MYRAAAAQDESGGASQMATIRRMTTNKQLVNTQIAIIRRMTTNKQPVNTQLAIIRRMTMNKQLVNTQMTTFRRITTKKQMTRPLQHQLSSMAVWDQRSAVVEA